MPAGLVTVISTDPAAPTGTMAVIEVAEFTTYDVAGTEPNRTCETFVKCTPRIVTDDPPAVEPLEFVSPVMTGNRSGMVKINCADELVAEVPPAVVTRTSAVPDRCSGVTAVMLVDEFTVKLVAATPPNVTAVAPVKLVPVMVTVEPPVVVAVPGVTLLTAGAAIGV